MKIKDMIVGTNANVPKQTMETVAKILNYVADSGKISELQFSNKMSALLLSDFEDVCNWICVSIGKHHAFYYPLIKTHGSLDNTIDSFFAVEVNSDYYKLGFKIGNKVFSTGVGLTHDQLLQLLISPDINNKFKVVFNKIIEISDTNIDELPVVNIGDLPDCKINYDDLENKGRLLTVDNLLN